VRTSRRGVATLAAGIVAAAALAGCGAGNNSQSSRPYTAPNAGAGTLGQLTITDVFLLPPRLPGGDASLHAAVITQGAPDQLVGVSVQSADPVTGTPVTLPAFTSTVLPVPDLSVSAVLPTPPGQVVGPMLTVPNLTTPAGSNVAVTFSFRDAGTLTIAAPVTTPQAAYTGVGS